MSKFYNELSSKEKGALLSAHGNPDNLQWHKLWEQIEAAESGEEEEDYIPQRGTPEWRQARDEYRANEV